MIVTAWNNGKHNKSGAGYGLKVSVQDRDANFSRAWDSVTIKLPDGTQVASNINKSSFWRDKCRELINKEFGHWLIDNGYAPWQKGRPPKFELTRVSDNQFRLDEK